MYPCLFIHAHKFKQSVLDDRLTGSMSLGIVCGFTLELEGILIRSSGKDLRVLMLLELESFASSDALLDLFRDCLLPIILVDESFIA